MKITFISDTHNKHKQITKDLPGGDVIVHAGDFSSMGYEHELKSFLEWFEKLDYTHKIFIAGNHDFIFEKTPKQAHLLTNMYDVIYLEDSDVVIDGIKFYGSPWQPEFMNWAFNLPRNGLKIEEKWAQIPSDTNVLITHGPAYGYLDVVRAGEHLGCEKLAAELQKKPVNIHVCGHIHAGYGQIEGLAGLHINAAMLNELYQYTNTPITVEL